MRTTLVFAITLNLITTFAQNPSFVYDIYPGGPSSSSFPSGMTAFNGKLYFSAKDATHGVELWVYDEISDPYLLADLSDYYSSPYSFVEYMDKLFFVANLDDPPGKYILSYDGVNYPEVVISGLSRLQYLTVFKDKLYFKASNASYGQELWVYDGVNDPEMVYDINPGTNDSEPSFLFVYNDKLLFRAKDESHGYELWEYDGVNPPVMLRDINPGDKGSFPGQFEIYFDILYFSAMDHRGYQLYKYDGIDNPRAAKIINPDGSAQIDNLEVLNDKLYFAANNGVNGRELMEYDMVKDTIITYDLVEGKSGSWPSYIIGVFNKLYFAADNDSLGREIWMFDGENFPEVLEDINPGMYESDPTYLQSLNGNLYFAADDGTHGRELWKYKIADIFETACYSYTTPGGRLLTESGTYFDTIPDMHGHDSIIQIDLTVVEVNTEVVKNRNVLSAKANGADFQWLNCENDFIPVNGMNSDSLVAQENGTFAVQVSYNGCVDTSECFQINIAAIRQDEITQTLKVFPNPTTGNFKIELDHKYDNIKLVIRNLSGNIVLEEDFHHTDELNYEITGSNGLYVIELYASEERIAVLRMIKSD